jgi:hypothetical protein
VRKDVVASSKGDGDRSQSLAVKMFLMERKWKCGMASVAELTEDNVRQMAADKQRWGKLRKLGIYTPQTLAESVTKEAKQPFLIDQLLRPRSVMVVGAPRLSAVVGRESAGTNGSMTALTLPGGFGFSFTGMEVRNPDGSRFHGVGIRPDIEVPVDARDLANGIDRDLLMAMALF